MHVQITEIEESFAVELQEYKKRSYDAKILLNNATKNSQSADMNLASMLNKIDDAKMKLKIKRFLIAKRLNPKQTEDPTPDCE